MDLKITAIEREDKIELGDLKNFCDQKGFFCDEPLVFDKNENSDLVPIALPATQEFFEMVFEFTGPFWETYSKIGFAVRPFGLKHIVFVQGRMYFLKNIENKFLNSLGPEETFYKKDNLLIRQKKIGLSNILLLFSYPFDVLKQFARTISLGFTINEEIRNFEDFRKITIEYYEHYSDKFNMIEPLKVAEESLGSAVRAVKYTNLALLSYSLKIKFRNSEKIENCELEELHRLNENKKWDVIRNKFGFYSLSPYDITLSRFREDLADLKKYGLPLCPISMALKWRENAKFLVARYLDIERLAFKKIGEVTGLGELVFYLKISELKNVKFDDKKELDVLAIIARERKECFEKWRSVEPPPRIILDKSKIYISSAKSMPDISHGTIYAMSVSGRNKVQGAAVNINSFDDYSKCKEGSIIISRTLSPNLAILFGRSVGVISEAGGALSHAALVAREMGLPCFVQAILPEKIEDGQNIEMDGVTGEARLLKKGLVFSKIMQKKSRNLVLTPQAKNNTVKENSSNILRSKKNIIWLGDSNFNSADIGIKAANLSRLSLVYSVPIGFSVTAKVFSEFLRSEHFSGLADKIERMDQVNILEIEKFSAEIKNIIYKFSFSAEFENEIEESFNKIGSSVAVRSSFSIEDLENASFAGQFDTVLGVETVEGVKKAIKKCWASFYNTRAVVYRIENNISGINAGMAVLVQKMIKAKYSGVTFTASPDSNEKILIEAVMGQGESLVSGESVPNFYRINKENFLIAEERENFSMDKKNLRRLAEMGLGIEKYFVRPQDIEWCIDHDNKVWLLQSRPITASRL